MDRDAIQRRLRSERRESIDVGRDALAEIELRRRGIDKLPADVGRLQAFPTIDERLDVRREFILVDRA